MARVRQHRQSLGLDALEGDDEELRRAAANQMRRYLKPDDINEHVDSLSRMRNDADDEVRNAIRAMLQLVEPRHE